MCLKLCEPEGDCCTERRPYGPIAEWDVSRVKDMSGIFEAVTAFDGDISKWDVSSVTEMSGMFRATSFPGDISKWDVSSVIKMTEMFAGATAFNGDLSKWDVSGVVEMSGMFVGATSFNGDLSKWDVSSVISMANMFSFATLFNGDLSKWDVSSVTAMNNMFGFAITFNGDISKWDVSSVTNMDSMFDQAESFKQTLCGAAWVNSMASKDGMFLKSPGSISPVVCTSPPVTGPEFSPQSKVELEQAVFFYLERSPAGDSSDRPHGLIGEWDVSRVTDMTDLFLSATFFNGDISKWDVSSVTTMGNMFAGATSFNGDISKWDVSSVTEMSDMFASATVFNGDLSKWDVSSVIQMDSMFHVAKSFDGDISKWDVSRVITMRFMFCYANDFNGDISKWDVSNVKNMGSMFLGAVSFNADISKWDVSSVTNMDFMFQQAESFKRILCGVYWIYSKASKKAMPESIMPTMCSAMKSSMFSPQSKAELQTAVDTCIELSPTGDCSNGPYGPIGEWDLSQISDMSNMFSYEAEFNADISRWDVSNVRNMGGMFIGAKSFNVDLSKWDVSSVTAMDYMFYEVISFKQKLCGDAWINSKASKHEMFAGSFGSIASAACSTTRGPVTSVFSPQSKAELQTAVDTCIELSPTGDCSNGPYGPIGEWDVSRVTDMSNIFSYESEFNGDISNWDVSNVKNMGSMFIGAKSFNIDISKWDVSSVTTMDYMFFEVMSFKQKLCGDAWINSKASKHEMFAGSFGSIASAVCSTTRGPVTSVFSPQSKAELQIAVDDCLELSPIGDCFNGEYGPIGEWDVSQVTDMSNVFSYESEFNGDISKWDVSNANNMGSMFLGAKSFNIDLSKWDVSNVKNMGSMFIGAESFNGDISKWDVSNVKHMGSMFIGAKSFNGDISKWDVSSVTNMDQMFWRAESFNGDISKWDVSSVMNMDQMFWEAESFKQKLGGVAWVNSKASKHEMFADSFGSISSVFSPQSKAELQSAVHACLKLSPTEDCSKGLYGPIGEWDVSRVIDMSNIFSYEAEFNGDISKWDVSNVKDMSGMFLSATSFNGDLSKWDVSSVTNMDEMFWGVISFKQKLCGDAWINSKASKNGMFSGSFGSISLAVCPPAPTTRQSVPHLPITKRELIARTPITSTIANVMTCPKCGTFKKSGRLSCCAPGGAWFKNCGGVGKKNVEHRWFEGVKACKPTAISSVCPKCGTIAKSGKASCCGRGGFWFGNCGSSGNAKLHHTWYEGINACKARGRSETAVSQQRNAAQQENMDSSNDTDISTSDNMSVITSANTRITTAPNTSITTSDRMSMISRSTSISMTRPVHTPVSTSITGQGCEKLLLNVVVFIGILLI